MPSKPKLADPGALIRRGKLQTTEWRVCLDPDLVDEYESLTTARESAAVEKRDSLDGGSATAGIDSRLEELREEMEESTLPLTLQALPRPKWRALVAEHPPLRKEDGTLVSQRDVIGVNYETFFNALLRRRDCIVHPVLAVEDLDVLLDERLSDGQWDNLATTAWNLNRQTVDVPFSPAVSPKTKTS